MVKSSLSLFCELPCGSLLLLLILKRWPYGSCVNELYINLWFKLTPIFAEVLFSFSSHWCPSHAPFKKKKKKLSHVLSCMVKFVWECLACGWWCHLEICIVNYFVFFWYTKQLACSQYIIFQLNHIITKILCWC